MLKEPSSSRRRLAAFTAAIAVFVLAPAAAQAASLKVIFPQSVEVTVVQGQSTDFTMELTAQGATACSATTAPVRVDTLYSLDTVGDTAAGLPADIPIVTEQNR